MCSMVPKSRARQIILPMGPRGTNIGTELTTPYTVETLRKRVSSSLQRKRVIGNSFLMYGLRDIIFPENIQRDTVSTSLLRRK
jgi:hypothetical protein